jgi:hypothetical protein
MRKHRTVDVLRRPAQAPLRGSGGGAAVTTHPFGIIQIISPNGPAVAPQTQPPHRSGFRHTHERAASSALHPPLAHARIRAQATVSDSDKARRITPIRRLPHHPDQLKASALLTSENKGERDVRAVICGTDVSFAAAGIAGFIYGREFAAMDDDGTAYFVEPIIYGGKCEECQSGNTQRCTEPGHGTLGLFIPLGAGRCLGVPAEPQLQRRAVEAERQLHRLLAVRGRPVERCQEFTCCLVSQAGELQERHCGPRQSGPAAVRSIPENSAANLTGSGCPASDSAASRRPAAHPSVRWCRLTSAREDFVRSQRSVWASLPLSLTEDPAKARLLAVDGRLPG